MKPHILFIDDEVALCEILSLFFRHKGLDVTTAICGQEARDLLQKEQFDAVVLDLNLAGEDGLELLGLIKQRLPSLPVIIFTGTEVDEQFIRKCLADRADGFMRKTQGLHNLLAEVQRHLSKNAAGQDRAEATSAVGAGSSDLFASVEI